MTIKFTLMFNTAKYSQSTAILRNISNQDQLSKFFHSRSIISHEDILWNTSPKIRWNYILNKWLV